MSETENRTASEAAESETVEMPDVRELKTDDLVSLIDDGTVPDSEPEAEPEEPTEQPEEETEAEEVEEPEEAEEATEEPTETPDALKDEPDENQVRLTEAQATAKHFESVAGRVSGKLGYVEQQKKSLENQVAQLQQQLQASQQPKGEAPEFTEQWQQSATQAAPAQQPAVDQNAIYHSANAVKQSLADFAQANPEIAPVKDGTQVLDEAFAKEIQARGTDILNLAQSGDALGAQQASHHIYAEAWSKVQRDRAVTARQEMERRKVDQAEKFKKNKRAQASASTAGKRASPPKRRVSSVKDLSNDDLAKLVESRAGLE